MSQPYRESCIICGSTAGRYPGHRHDPSGVVFMTLFHLLIWGVPALVMGYVALMFVKALITGEPSL